MSIENTKSPSFASVSAQNILGKVAQLSVTSFKRPEDALDAVLDTMSWLLTSRTLFLARYETNENVESGRQLNVVKVLDKGGCPLQPGPAGPLYQTYCNTIAESFEPLIVEDSSQDPFYRGLPSTSQLGIRSYIGVPLIYSDGRVYGTLCGIDPLPLRMNGQPELVQLLQMLARMLITQIELDELNVQLQSSNDSKSRFMAIVTHDLKQPLTAIKAMSQFIARKQNLSPERVTQYAGQIEHGADRMLGQIDELLEYSKASADKLELFPSKQLVTPLLEDARQAVQPHADSKQIALSLNINTGPEQSIVVDQPRFHRILVNLLTNALKFTPAQGQITLSATYATSTKGQISLSADPFALAAPWVFATSPLDKTPDHTVTSANAHTFQDGDWIAISVADTGYGISPAELPLIFDDFRQASQENHQQDGSGLGLSIVRYLITLMKGFVAVRSVDGQGSCFTVFLPI